MAEINFHVSNSVDLFHSDDVVMSGKPTHYEVLGVSKYATYAEIKDSFHRLARLKHPDKQRRQKSEESIREDSQNKDENADSVKIPTEGDEIAAEFRKIQQAWQVLRDEEERSAYDSDLLHKDLQEESKRNGAIVLDFNDLEEAIDEETDETFMVYDCRCGEEIHIEMSKFSDSVSDYEEDKACCKPAQDDNNEIFVDCPGCCFVYRIIGR